MELAVVMGLAAAWRGGGQGMVAVLWLAPVPAASLRCRWFPGEGRAQACRHLLTGVIPGGINPGNFPHQMPRDVQ